MLPDGTVLEGTGIAPDVRVELPNDAYRSADPTLESGLELLRARVKKADKADP